jgi:uncharacterized membrane protein YqgA involved in biofilm formation
VNEGFVALGLFFVGLVLLGWAGVHVIYAATVGAPTNTQLVTGLCIAGGALLVAGGVIWKRST